MKKIFPFIATLLLLNGCTLSMEDFSIPEEERGMDEIYTEDTGYGKVSYQFADSVVNLTENLQDQYLVRVADEQDELADSVIYISGSIPKNYRPYIGQKIYAGFGYNFPKAFSGRVIAVEDQGGIYKVTTTRIQKDEIFKHLSYKFDQTVETNNTEYLKDLNDDILERLGYQRLADSTLVDWNLYDSVQAARGNEKAKARIRKRGRTRAEITDNSDVREFISWSIDSRDLSGGKTFFDITKFSTWAGIYRKTMWPTTWEKWDPYFVLSFKVKNYTKCHAEKDEERDYEINYTDSWSVINIVLDFGVTATKDLSKSKATTEAEREENKQLVNSFFDNFTNLMLSKNGQGGDKATIKEWASMMNQMNPKSSSRKMNKSKFPVAGFEFNKHVPFGPWFAIDIEATGGPVFEFTGMLSLAGEITTAKHRSGKECKGGDNIVTIDEDIEKASGRITKFGGKCSLKIGYNVRVGVDFLFAGTAGVGFGLNVEAALAGDFGFDIYNNESGNEQDVWFKPNGSLKFYVDFWCDFRFIVKPLGFTLWEKKIADFPDPHLHIFYWSTGYSPSVGDLLAQVTSEDGTTMAFARVNYTDLDGVWSAIGSKYYPMMRMYMGPVKNGKYVYMTPSAQYMDHFPIAPSELGAAHNSLGKFLTSFFNTDYNYYYDGDIPVETTELHFVPMLISYTVDEDNLDADWNNNVKYEDSKYGVNDDYLVEIGPSSITTESSLQTYGGECMDWAAMEKGEFIDSQGGSLNGVGSVSINPDDLSMYKFATRLKVFNASRIVNGTAKLYVAIYNSKKQVICKRWVPIKDIKSGTYTYQFHFVTDWKKPEYPASGTDEILYYRVLPYWNDQTEGEKKYIDSKSRKYYEIEYRKAMVNISGSKWGTVMPEIDLNQAK